MISTPWNSTFFMLERILKLKEPVQAALGVLNNSAIGLAESEWMDVRQLCKVLEPFESITKELSSEKKVSLSKIPIMIQGLKIHLQKLSDNNENENNVAVILSTINTEVDKRFRDYEKLRLIGRAMIFDPRFKEKVFSDTDALKITKESIIQDLLQEPNVEAESEAIAIQKSDTDEEGSIWSHFDNKVTSTCSEATSTNMANLEFRQYMEEAIIRRKDNPLSWWKSREKMYPHLAKIAKKVLCVPATSVPSERIFSKAGQLISDRRSRLKPSNVETILFLNANLN